MSQPPGDRTGPAWPVDVLDRLPSGIAVLDPRWILRYVNPAGIRLLGARGTALAGRDLWEALPELSGSVFLAFLRHARTVGTPVSWTGFYPPTRRWLNATAEVVDGLLQVQVVEAGDTPADGADADRLRFLAEVSESLIASLDTGETADQLARVVVPRLADWSTVLVLGEDGAPDRTARAHRDPAREADVDTYLTGRPNAPRDRPLLAEALVTGEPVQVRTIDTDLGLPSPATPAVREAWQRLQPTSSLFVPLHARGQVFGVLSLVTCGERPPHTESQIATAVEVARRGALALDNTRLYGRQLQVAETLQHSLLTPPPRPEGLEIAVRYRPASSHALVGGDWYDAFEQLDGATMLVIGDVVGHNVEAASAMAQLRSAVRTLAYDRPDSPARTLARVDRVLAGLHVGTLATALVARLEAPDDDGTRTLRWSSAGHLPPLLLRPDGNVRLLASPPERLLGTDEPSSRTDHEATVHAGETVLLVTDGLVEVGRGGIDPGLARLSAVLAELGGAPTDEVCDVLLARIVADRADDDVAILAARLLPERRPPVNGDPAQRPR